MRVTKSERSMVLASVALWMLAGCDAAEPAGGGADAQAMTTGGPQTADATGGNAAGATAGDAGTPAPVSDSGAAPAPAAGACSGASITCRYVDPTSNFDSCVDYYGVDGWDEATSQSHCDTLADGGKAVLSTDDTCFAEGIGEGDSPEGRCIVLGGDSGTQRAQIYGSPEGVCTAYVGAWEAGRDPVCGDAGGGAAPPCDGTELFGFCIPFDLGGGGGGEPDGDPAADVVTCQAAGAATNACAEGQICCFAGGLAAEGFACADSAAECPAEAMDVQACDGPEDCGSGEFCCSGSSGGSCESDINDCSGTNLVGCHTLADCAEFAPATTVCRLSAFGGTPWGICAD